MKLVPEKDSAASEAQTGLPLDDPEGPGQPKGKDGTQYGSIILVFILHSLCVCVHVQISPFYRDAGRIGLQPTHPRLG